MKAYRVSLNLKLGLVIFAVVIAVASLAYTQRLVERLGEREQFIIRLWASAQEQVAEASLHVNPYFAEFEAMSRLIADGDAGLTTAERQRLQAAINWARSMPPAGELALASEILLQGHFGVPAIIVDSALGRPVAWHNVGVPPTLHNLSPDDSSRVMSRLFDRVSAMGRVHRPVSIDIRPIGDGPRLRQYVFYDESSLIKELRIFPYIQLIVVALFVLVGYLGFSYVRRSEQRSLWVGMAKEAAHQLGTPISSLMGWLELLRAGALPASSQQEAVEEMDEDVRRLQRVASRFSDIGSLPRLEVEDLSIIIHETAEYIRKRMPERGRQITLQVETEPGLYTPANSELFEWVIENLLKNALDAVEGDSGRIEIRAWKEDRRVLIDVEDSGKGIERREWKNIFRPGYSTKKRGWGLGLSLAKRIVEDYHGGQLRLLQSRVGQGSTFRIELPIADQEGG